MFPDSTVFNSPEGDKERQDHGKKLKLEKADRTWFLEHPGISNYERWSYCREGSELARQRPRSICTAGERKETML